MDTETFIRWTGDLAAGGIAFAAFMSWMPAVASLLSVVWFGIQIVESKTGQYWIKRMGAFFRAKRH